MNVALPSKLNVRILVGFSAISIISFLAGIYLQEYALYAIPFALIYAYFCVVNFKTAFLIMMFAIPFSAEIKLGNGFATDLPAEPIMVVLMFVYLFYSVTKRKVNVEFIRHPIIQLLLIHLIWIAITVIFSAMVVISLKFLFAKLWYVIVFVFMTGILIKEERDFKALFWVIFIPLSFTVINVLIKHALFGFAWDKVNEAVIPYFRNHVNYAAIISLFYPFIWLAASWYERGSFKRNILLIARIIFLAALLLAFTRGAVLAIIIGMIVYFITQRRLLKVAIPVTIIFMIGVCGYFLINKKYLDYAPDFQTTIYHANIQDHLKATSEANDISTVERFYRWIAAVRMSTTHPITGFGPNNFYHHYQQYAVSSFYTYVSDNPEKSGVHNYFLLMLTEQGFVGLFIFTLLSIAFLYHSIRQYYAARSRRQRQFIAAIMISTVVIFVQLLLSDLVEALKIGFFFYINMALIVNIGMGHLKFEDKVENDQS